MSRTPKVNIAWSMLFHSPKRLVLSVGGIAFATLIMFMQLGFFNGINDSQAMHPPRWQADLVMLAETNVHMSKWDRFHRTFLGQVAAQQGVAEAIPLHYRNARMLNTADGLPQVILVTAFPPGSGAVDLGPNSEAIEQGLVIANSIAFDRLSRDIYGPVSTGDEITFNGRAMHVTGLYEFGPNLSIDGNVVMSEGNWLASSPSWERDQVSYGLIRLEPGADLESTRQRIQAAIPDSLILLTPEEMRHREVMHTIKAVPIGAIFGIGLVIGFVIGVVICYQILFNEITDHMAQFATMMAMGYGPKDIRSIVLQEATLLSCLGFLVGLGASIFLYLSIADKTGLLLLHTPIRVGAILICTVLMCVLAGNLAVRKALKADPADLF